MTVNKMPAPTTGEAEEPEKAKGGGKKKLIIVLVIVLVLVLVLGGAGWYFFLRPSGGKEPPPTPGLVIALEPVQINLTEGHYLRIGIALQLIEGVAEADGSKALDAVIDIFSGRPTGELNRSEGRQKLKKELTHVLEEAYEGEVMGVYFTEFVTQ